MPVEKHTEESCKCLTSLRAPPTAMNLQNSKLTIAHKSGEIITFNMETKEKKVLAKETVAVTAICQIQEVLLVGNRRGEIKVQSGKSLKRVSKRHKSHIVSISAIETESGEIEIISTSGDHRIYFWKLDINKSKKKKAVHLLFVKSLYGPSSAITSASLSPSKNLFLCTSELSEVVRVFRLEKDTQLLFRLEKDFAQFGLFISDSYFVVASNTNSIYLFSVNQTVAEQSITLPLEMSTGCEVSLIKLLENKKCAVGITNGRIFILDFSKSISVVSSIRIDAIPNDMVQIGKSLHIIGGKEERHSRFFVNKSVSNGVFTYELA